MENNSYDHNNDCTIENIYFYIELPLFVNGMLYNWDEYNSNRFMETVLDPLLGSHAPITSKFEMRKNIMNYFDDSCDKKFPLIYVEFFNFDDLLHCINILNHPIKTSEWGYMICKMTKMS